MRVATLKHSYTLSRRSFAARAFGAAFAMMFTGGAAASRAQEQTDGAPPSPAPASAAPGADVPSSDKSKDEYVWLRAKGQHIVTSPLSEGGERPFIAAGIGYCRNVIMGDQDDAVMKFCKERHLNTIRLSFYTRFFNNKPDKPIDIDDHIRNFIAPVLEAARKAKIYVILDDHGYLSAEIDEATAREKQKARLWAETDLAAWTGAWVKVAQYFKDEPYVLGYELMNEPHDIPAEDARAKLTRCLKAVREVDQRHIVLLGNHNWSHSRGMEKCWGPVANTVDAPHNNVVFTFHDYPEDDHPWKVQKNVTAFRDKYQVPVMCTEFGATRWNKSETVCRTFQAGMLALFAREDIGWMIWALKLPKEKPGVPPAPLPPDTSPTSAADAYKTELPQYDPCAYTDTWAPVARIMASPFPRPASAPSPAQGPA